MESLKSLMKSLFTYVFQVCIKIESPGGDAPKMFGRHFDDKDMVISKVGSILANLSFARLVHAFPSRSRESR